jgi:hypothetical protein
MRLDLVTLFPRQAVPMLQGLLRFDNGWNGLFFGALPHLRPEGGRNVDITDRHLLESHGKQTRSPTETVNCA